MILLQLNNINIAIKLHRDWIGKKMIIERYGPKYYHRISKIGNLKWIKCLCRCNIYDIHRGINLASRYGHLNNIKYLYWNGATHPAVINLAAAEGYLDIVIWLHKKYRWRCTTSDMDRAALRGRFDVVKYLHFYGKVGCTKEAMDKAARNGHLNVVKFLYKFRSEGCTEFAVNQAIKYGRLNVVKYLYEHMNMRCNTETYDYIRTFRPFTDMFYYIDSYRNLS
jgi:hypothetical protein